MLHKLAPSSSRLSPLPPPGAARQVPADDAPVGNAPPGGPAVGADPVEPPSYREALELQIRAEHKLVAAMELIESSLRKGLEGSDVEAQKFLEDRSAGIPSAGPLSSSAAELVERHDLVSAMQRKLGYPRQKLLELEGEMRHHFPLMARVPGLVREAHVETGPLPAQAALPPPYVAGEDAAVAANPDFKAQRKLAKKARQELKQPGEPANCVRQAEVSRRPEVAALAHFITDHFEGRLLPLADDAWRDIANWAGLRNLSPDAQRLARDFGQLTADQRSGGAVMIMVHDERREAARLAPQAKKPEQKDPGPARQGVARAGPSGDSAAKPVVVHVPEVKPPESVIAQPAQPDPTQLEKFQRMAQAHPNELDLLADFIASHLAINGNAGATLGEIHQWPGFGQLDRNVKRLADGYCKLTPVESDTSQLSQKVFLHFQKKTGLGKGVPAQVPAAASAPRGLPVAGAADLRAKDEPARLLAEHERDAALMTLLQRDLADRKAKIPNMEFLQAKALVYEAKHDAAPQTVHWKVTHHPTFEGLTKSLQEIAIVSARIEDTARARLERIAYFHKLKG